MSILSIAMQHFNGLLEKHVLKELTVDEWKQDGKPMKIFFQSLATLAIKKFSEIVELSKKGRIEDFVDILIVRCCDEHGKPLFKKTDRLELLHHVSPQVVCRILAEMGDLDDSLVDLPTPEKKAPSNPKP